jgi:predicted DNA-binding protein YlxM (UPF0122 family)
MPDRTTNRSNAYQPNLLEISVNPNILGDLSSAQGMTFKMQPFDYNEQLLDLKEELKKRMWEIIEKGVTKRQIEVLKLYIQGYTQSECAQLLNINQTSIHKILQGNLDYRSKNDENNRAYRLKKNKRRYGGVIKKIRRLCKEDPTIQRILNDIAEICESMEV